MNKSIFKIITLFTGAIGGALCAFLIQVILARQLTLETYGIFATVLATVTLLSPLASMGVPGFLVRVFGSEGKEGIRWLVNSLKLVCFGITSVLIVLLLWGWLGPHGSVYFKMLCWMMPIVIGQAFAELITVKLQLEERFNTLAVWQMTPQLMRVLLIIVSVAYIQYEPMQNVYAAAYFVSSFIVAMIGVRSIQLWMSDRFYLKGHSKIEPVMLSDAVSPQVILRHSLPFALTGILYVIYFQSDIILLNYLYSSEVAGLYNVAFTMMVAVYLLPSIIYQKFLLPKLYRWVNHDKKQFLKVFRVGNAVMAISGIFVMIMMFWLMPLAIPLLFGEAYQNVISFLNILLLCIPVRFIASCLASALVSEKNIIRKVRCMAAVAMINVILNIILIPYFGGVGAAITTVISEVLLLLMFYRTVKRYVDFT